MAPNAELQRQVRALQQSYDAGDVQESGKLLTKLKVSTYQLVASGEGCDGCRRMTGGQIIDSELHG